MEKTQFNASHLKGASLRASYSSDSEEDDDHLPPSTDPTGDYDAEYRPRKRRRMGGDNRKERAALGIFGSDSEDDGPGKRWKTKTLRHQGLSFVSKGNKSLEDEEYSEGKAESDAMDVDGDGSQDEDEDGDGDEETGRTGLGFGMGFRPQSFQSNGNKSDSKEGSKSPERPSFKPKFDGKAPLGRGFVPSSAYDPVLRDDIDDTPSAPKAARPSAFSGRGKGKPNAQSFGARMMAKMGYVEGRGLGKEGQGRNIIIEANLRPQGVGLGAVKEKSEQERQEEKRQARLRGETVEDSDEERKKERKKKKKPLGGGVDSNTSTPRRQKTKYLTAEEIKRAAPGLHIPDAFAPILDMTGPGSKLLTTPSGLNTPTSVPEPAETIEARKLIRRAHLDLSTFSEEWKSLSERQIWVDRQLGECEEEMEALTADHEKLRAFADIITNELPAAGDQWQEVIQCLHKAANVTPPNAEVAGIVVAAIEPFFRDPEWDPLKDPSKFASDLRGMESLLMPDVDSGKSVDKFDSSMFNGDGIYRQHHRVTTPYESLMYKLWLPRVLRAVRECDAYDPSQAMGILDNWDGLLPPFIRAHFIENVVRKLHTAMAEWNPRLKRQSNQLPHVWLFPWLPFLPAYHLDPKGTGLVSDVKRKFRQLIEVWEFERGTIPGLRRWRDILGDQWQPLIVSHLVPSMGRYVNRHFRVDPSDQEPYLPILDGVLKWGKMLPPEYLAEVVVGKVFPMWHQKLGEWFELEEANLDEIATWFEWWNQYYPPDVARLLRAEFERALLTMERTLDRMP